MRLAAILAILALCLPLRGQNPETAQFPSAAAGDDDLGVHINEYLAFTTLASGIDDSTTTIPFTDASGYPEYTRIRIDNEILHCTTKSGNNFTCSRGDEGSSAASHSSGAVIRAPITAAALNKIAAEVKALTLDAPCPAGRRTLIVEILGPTTAATTGNGKRYVPVPLCLNGLDLVALSCHVITAGTTNTLSVGLDRCAAVATGGTCSGTVADMLTTNLTIDSGESKSSTADTPVSINTSNDDVVTDQVLRFNIDAIHTTPSQGLICATEFQ